jgi:hypothetical protein
VIWFMPRGLIGGFAQLSRVFARTRPVAPEVGHG